MVDGGIGSLLCHVSLRCVLLTMLQCFWDADFRDVYNVGFQNVH